MQIHLHDFSGHPFQAQLSRALAANGHDVIHTFSKQYASGKGLLERQPEDPRGLRFREVDAGVPFLKYNPRGRLRFERAHAREWQALLDADRPDVVIACNVPLLALRWFSKYAYRARLPWVLWHQDIFSSAMGDELGRRLPRVLGPQVTAVLEHVERRIVGSADQAVVIGDEFVNKYREWGVDLSKVSVLPNWAPVDEIVPVARENAWSASHFGDPQKFRMLYAGTLGRKHNPRLLVDLLHAVRDRGLDAELRVVSEGDGASDLSAELIGSGDAAAVFGFQPAAALPQVLGSADVLVTLLEPDASRYSIPSKVLSYLSAGRPVLGMMPADNPAAQDIRGAGGVVENPDMEGVRRAADWVVALAQDPSRRTQIGVASRRLVEERSDIVRIALRFERILGDATGLQKVGRR